MTVVLGEDTVEKMEHAKSSQNRWYQIWPWVLKIGILLFTVVVFQTVDSDKLAIPISIFGGFAGGVMWLEASYREKTKGRSALKPDPLYLISVRSESNQKPEDQ